MYALAVMLSISTQTTSKDINKISQRIPENNNVGLSNYQHPTTLSHSQI